ncbi:MAG: hypothetical protein CVV40_00475, partial [Planctomycetes bacterium HGW-Planctomycetes-2]
MTRNSITKESTPLRQRSGVAAGLGLITLTLSILALGQILPGCSSARPRASEVALAKFERQDYQGALRSASASHARSAGANQAEAAYIAGRS